MDRIRKDANGTYLLDPYFRYLESIQDNLPSSIREFALDPGRYDLSRGSLHDAWVSGLALTRNPRLSSEKPRLDLDLLGSYHDRSYRLTYLDLVSFAVEGGALMDLVGSRDMLVHEFDLDCGSPRHSMRFQGGYNLVVVARDIVFSEREIAEEPGDRL